MARGDFRFTPRYQFWSTIVLMIVCGSGFGWFLDRDHIDVLIGILPGLLIAMATIAWLNRRGSLYRSPSNVEPYEHPILGLYVGLSATITLLVVDETWQYAVLVGGIMGGLFSVAVITSRRWRTRNDPPNRQRPIPTLTGWR